MGKNRDKPLISIIMNCYNGEKYLRESLNSVLKQTYKNWEIIFLDNQSNDASAKIFKDYKDDRLKYYCADSHIEILNKARNYALKKVNGEFIAFLDVDDWWLPEKLEKQIPLFDDPDVGLVYGNVWLFLEKKNIKKIYKKGNLPTGMILNELLNDYVIGSPTYVIRKKSLESLEYCFSDDFHIIGDFDINTRLAAKWKVKCVQSAVAFWRMHGKNLSIRHREKEIHELKTWFKQMKNNQLISSQTHFNRVLLSAYFLETMQSIMKNGFVKSFLMVAKYPFCFNKIKLILALLLPKFLLKEIKNY